MNPNTQTPKIIADKLIDVIKNFEDHFNIPAEMSRREATAKLECWENEREFLLKLNENIGDDYTEFHVEERIKELSSAIEKLKGVVT